MLHSEEKCKMGTLLDLLTYILLQKTRRGDPLGIFKKISKKSRTVPKKSKGGPFNLVPFCMIHFKSEK